MIFLNASIPFLTLRIPVVLCACFKQTKKKSIYLKVYEVQPQQIFQSEV